MEQALQQTKEKYRFRRLSELQQGQYVRHRLIKVQSLSNKTKFHFSSTI